MPTRELRGAGGWRGRLVTALRRRTLRRGLLAIMLLSLLAVPGLYLVTKEQDSAQRSAAEELPLALHQLERAIGYSGFIHNFKNAILRPDEPVYMARTQADYETAVETLRRIHELGVTLGSDLRLSSLHATLATYRENLDLARRAAAEGLSVRQVDALVRTSDDAATLDLLALQDEITLAIHDWQRHVQLDRRVMLLLLAGLLLLVAVSTAAMLLTGSAAQRDRERRSTELHDRLASLGQVTSGLAHDVNNLLATIYYALELARNEDLPEPARRYLQSATRAVARGKELTGRLLSIARPSKGQPETRSVAGLFLAAEELALPHFEGSDLTLTFDVAEPGLMCHCDPGMLQDSLLNLVLNARDAIQRSGEGGTIRVRAHSIDPAILRQDEAQRPGTTEAVTFGSLQLDATRRYVEITISDDGPGMSKKVRDHALEPFFTTRRDGTGVGLGLSMAFSFARGAGGDLRLDSERGAGTVIQMILPRDPLPDEEEKPRTSGAGKRPSAPRPRPRAAAPGPAPDADAATDLTGALPRGRDAVTHLSGAEAPTRLASSRAPFLKDADRAIRLPQDGARNVTQAFPFAAGPANDTPPAAAITGHASAPTKTPEPPAESSDAAGSSQPTVLVAEDETALRMLLVATLSNAGFEVLSAENGAKALSLLEDRGAQSVDLLLTDVMMPELDGFGLAKAARDLRHDLPVVYLTGFVGTGPEDSPRPLVQGPVLRKPCPPDRLIRILTQSMGTLH